MRSGSVSNAGALEEEESTGVRRSRFDSLTAREREVLDHVVRDRGPGPRTSWRSS
jgi:FixJ family two-component response regulator